MIVLLKICHSNTCTYNMDVAEAAKTLKVGRIYIMKRSSLCGKNENKKTNKIAGVSTVFSLGTRQNPIGTNRVLKPRERGMAE